MDRSTEVTIRSAIIIGCMILVPLWAVMGTSWTSVFHEEVDGNHGSRTQAGAGQHPRSEPRREPIKPPETGVAEAPSDGATPLVSTPTTTGESVAAMTPSAPAVQHLPPVNGEPPSIHPTNRIRPLDEPGLQSIANPGTGNRIAVDPTAIKATPAVATTANVQQVSTRVAEQRPVQPPALNPAAATPGDWFQWTEARLRYFGASQFILESSSEAGGYRFRCKVPLAEDPGFTRHFEATGDSALAAMQTVLQQVEQWRSSVK